MAAHLERYHNRCFLMGQLAEILGDACMQTRPLDTLPAVALKDKNKSLYWSIFVQ
jgi:hypothetical protein